MNGWKCAIALVVCCIILTDAPPASADFVGVTTAIQGDPDIELLCSQGNGDFVPYPLTVCRVWAAFDDPDDVLLSVGNANLQVYNGQNPDVFFQHPFNGTDFSPYCDFLPIFPDLICDSFVTIGVKCGDASDGTSGDDFDSAEFNQNGHIVGGWFNSNPPNGQGTAGSYPDLQVLILQSSTQAALVLSGEVDLFWSYYYGGDVYAELAVPVECEVDCPFGLPCDDGSYCTQEDVCVNHVCVGTPVDCDDGNPCTDDSCDPADGQCVHIMLPDGTPCDDGDPCTYDDHCDYGECYGYDQWCTDNDDCTLDYCDPDSGCINEPIDCDDGDACTTDSCDPESGCAHEDIQCPEGQSCDPATGECVDDQDPCECVDGRVTLCHIPSGNLSNARTITVGCAARDKHLAHGDFCGPCE